MFKSRAASLAAGKTDEDIFARAVRLLRKPINIDTLLDQIRRELSAREENE